MLQGSGGLSSLSCASRVNITWHVDGYSICVYLLSYKQLYLIDNIHQIYIALQ